MENLTALPGRPPVAARILPKQPLFADAVDGPGWSDVVVDGYYDSNGNYVPPQYRSSHQGKLLNDSLTCTSPNILTKLVSAVRNCSGF